MSWQQGQSPARKMAETPLHKHDEDFRARFEPPEEEKLLEAYVCACQCEDDAIIHQGRMYVSDKGVYFYSIIIGLRKISLPFQDIISISKQKSAFVIPNALEIETFSARYYFTSFVSRDSAYDLLCDQWEFVKNPATSKSQAPRSKLSSSALRLPEPSSLPPPPDIPRSVDSPSPSRHDSRAHTPGSLLAEPVRWLPKVHELP